MDLRDYIIPLRKWWWLIVATTVVATLSSYVATRFEPPQYRTNAVLMVGQTIEDPNPDSYSFYATQQLAQSYAELAKREPVRDAVMERLGLTWLPTYQVGLVPNTQLLEITVVDSDKVRAQVVANTLAEQLVLQSPTNETENDPEQAFIQEQLTALREEISLTEEEIDNLEAEMISMISARQIADTQDQIATLQSKLNLLRSNYTGLLSNTREGAINTIRIVTRAKLPETPINAGIVDNLLLGAAIGLVLSAGSAYLMEFLDNTLKTPEEITKLLQVPVIGYVLDTVTADNDEKETVLVAEQPRSPVAEAFRTLRTNLEYASVDDPLRSILVTSAKPSDGKSSTAANLAVAVAQGGKRVVLVDADLRRPRVHRFAGVSNQFGLSDLFRDQVDVDDALQPWPGVAGVRVLTSGSLPPNPAELLGSGKMREILAQLEGIADAVVVDSPPLLVSDPAVLAPQVDGVLLVMQPGRTDARTAEAAMEQLHRVEANVVGIVLNRIPRRQGFYYGGYQYYYAPYYSGSEYVSNGHYKNGQGTGEVEGRWTRLARSLRGGEGQS